jgi:hypothetical protein
MPGIARLASPPNHRFVSRQGYRAARAVVASTTLPSNAFEKLDHLARSALQSREIENDHRGTSV